MPELESGGGRGLGDSGNARKKTFFSFFDVFPKSTGRKIIATFDLVLSFQKGRVRGLALLRSFQKRSGIYWSNIDVSDPWVSRGWESSHVIVGDLCGVTGVENLFMRTLGYFALVKQRKN